MNELCPSPSDGISVFTLRNKDPELNFGNMDIELPEWFDVTLQCLVYIKNKEMVQMQMVSVLYPDEPIWTVSKTSPTVYQLHCPHAWALKRETVATMLVRALNKLSIEKKIDPPHPELSIMIPITTNRNTVMLFNNDLCVLREGALDELGCLQGHAVVELVRPDTDYVLKISGRFLNHHFTYGEVSYTFLDQTCNTYSIVSYVSSSIVTGRLIVWSTQTPGETVTYDPLNFERLNPHEVVIDKKIEQVSTVTHQNSTNDKMVAVYNGPVVNLEAHGRGKKVEILQTETETLTAIYIGYFEHDKCVRPEMLVTECKSTEGITTVTYVYDQSAPVTAAGAHKVDGTRTTTFNDQRPPILDDRHGYVLGRTFIHGECKKRYKQGEHEILVVEEGEFNEKEELETSSKNGKPCSRKIYQDRILIGEQQGKYLHGHLMDGTKIELKSTMTEEYRGELKAVSTISSVEFATETIFHDPNGVLYRCYRSGDCEWTQGFRLGKPINPIYHLKFGEMDGVRQLVSVNQPGQGTLIRQHPDGQFLYQPEKSKDKKNIKMEKEKAVLQFHHIESILTQWGKLPPPSLAELAEEEEIERRQMQHKKQIKRKEERTSEKQKEAATQLKRNRKNCEMQKKAMEAEQQRQERIKAQQAHEAEVHAKRAERVAEILPVCAPTPQSLELMSPTTLPDSTANSEVEVNVNGRHAALQHKRLDEQPAEASIIAEGAHRSSPDGITPDKVSAPTAATKKSHVDVSQHIQSAIEATEQWTLTKNSGTARSSPGNVASNPYTFLFHDDRELQSDLLRLDWAPFNRSLS